MNKYNLLILNMNNGKKLGMSEMAHILVYM